MVQLSVDKISRELRNKHIVIMVQLSVDKINRELRNKHIVIIEINILSSWCS